MASQFETNDDVVAFDGTNLFTWIDSGNLRPKLPQRGHNKAPQYDLRQMGLALAATVNIEAPLFHHGYGGEQLDGTVSQASLQLLGLGEATAVYDGGNVSIKPRAVQILTAATDPG